jgi:hypothetical protein
MSKLSLTLADVQTLDLVANQRDLRRDLHTFVQYVRERPVKRAYRTNEIPPADLKRLGQLMKLDTEALLESDHDYFAGALNWVDYIDQVARKMGLVSYDTKGVYRGYSSTEPSFPDNVIQFNAENYTNFIGLPLAEQERQLLDTLVKDYDYSHNEFYIKSPLGRLDRFSTAGSATGVMPTLNFATIRRFLLELLQDCQAGEWYSTKSLVAYLKTQQPYFMIPQVPRSQYRGTKVERYGNFYEDQYARDPVPDFALNGFERVEGRYIERFLEGIPLNLGYVELAYSPQEPKRYPSLEQLQAFRLNDRFFQAMSGKIESPKVVVQPNFEIYLFSNFYPAQLFNQLSLIADSLSEETPTTILKLQKQKVKTQAAENGNFDAIRLLQNLTGRPLPQNVAVELKEWTEQAEVFTLYEGFGLLETAGITSLADPFIVDKIGESLKLVREPQKVLARFREAGEVILNVQHANDRVEVLPKTAQTLFPRRTDAKARPVKPEKQGLIIKREHLIALSFPSDETYEKFRKALLESECPVEANKETRQLKLSSRYEDQIQEVIKKLSNEYLIRLEDITG